MLVYWYKDCPSCHQGRNFVQKSTNGNGLFLECEECSLSWRTPWGLDNQMNWFRNDVGPYEYASKKDIEDAGWSEFTFDCEEHL